MRPRIAIIGAGKVGSTLARLLFQADYEIVAIYNRSQDKALELAAQTNALAVDHLDDVVSQADLVLLTVTDDAIERIAKMLLHVDWQDKAIVHTSGAASLDILQPLAALGAMVGNLHPAFPFADVETAIENLAGATFAIEASHQQLQDWLLAIIAVLKGHKIIIPAGKKALYHAALVLVSNYTVTLFAAAQRILATLEADQTASDNALMTLLEVTLKNIAEQGIPDALTGPLARADLGTIQAHLDAIDDERIRQAYISLARLSFPILEQRGIDTHTIEKLLQDRT